MSHRPLIISDADEVLLNFFEAFERWLIKTGYSINMASFALNGNIRNQKGETVSNLDVKHLIDDFFEAKIECIAAAPGAVHALLILSKTSDIIILTNIPEVLRERRERSMAELGMAYPVIANSGSKGIAVQALARSRQGPVLFIDDLPPHHAAVAKAAPHVHRLHMVANERLRLLVPDTSTAHNRIDRWDEALVYIQAYFKACE